jgi:endonuclease G, mitochondrial
MIRSVVLAALALLSLSATAQPLPDGCAANFAGGAPPAVDAKHAAQSRMLCYQQFALQHSALTKTPLWSAEHLTPDRIAAAEGLPRRGEFHAERRLPVDERAKLSDYKNSGYDRGHMSPSGDMPDPSSRQASFSLANIIPQSPCNNEVIWEQIESAVRDYVSAGNEVFVVTGPIYEGQTIATIGNGVAVPTRIFKAIYNPQTGEAGAYVTVNDDDVSDFQALTLAALQDATGIDLFPAAPAAKGQAMQLPPLPAPNHKCRLQ